MLTTPLFASPPSPREAAPLEHHNAMGCGSSIHVPKVNASDEFDVADAGKADNGLRVLKLILVGVSLNLYI